VKPWQRRARARNRPDLSSLFDVMFIVVFVALIRAASAQQEAAHAAAPPPPPPPPPPAVKIVPPTVPVDVAALRTQALAHLDANLAARTPLVLRVTGEGKLVSIVAGGAAPIAVDVALLAPDPDPDIAVRYVGDRSSELRLCRIAAVHLAVPDLAAHLVIVALDRPLAALDHVLFAGLHRDLDRCLVEQKALASLEVPP
jgi:hypothetical protein